MVHIFVCLLVITNEANNSEWKKLELGKEQENRYIIRILSSKFSSFSFICSCLLMLKISWHNCHVLGILVDFIWIWGKIKICGI